jgi:hypothetical protein
MTSWLNYLAILQCSTTTLLQKLSEPTLALSKKHLLPIPLVLPHFVLLDITPIHQAAIGMLRVFALLHDL